MPLVVESDQLQPANAFVRLALNGSNVVGAGVGGVLVAAAGPGYAIAFDAATYLLSAIVLARMTIGGVVAAAGESILRDLVEGWNEFRSREWLWVIVACASMGNLVAMASLNVLGPLIAKRDLGGAPAYGAIVAAQGAGLLVGGMLSLRWRPRRPLLVGTLGLLPTAVTIACYAGVRITAVIAAAAFFAGVGVEIFGVSWITALHEHIPPAVLSRVSSYDALGSFVFIPVGLVIAGPLADRFGVTETLWGLLAVGVLSVFAALASRDVRELERSPARSEPPEAAAVGAYGEDA
jgi:predicted MFS family arabinose efflux permease